MLKKHAERYGGPGKFLIVNADNQVEGAAISAVAELMIPPFSGSLAHFRY